MEPEIYYGSDDVKLNITNFIKEKLKNCDHFIIPGGDSQRAELFGDPIPFTLKRIYIARKETVESYSKDTILSINKNFEITVKKAIKSAVVAVAKFEQDYIIDFVNYHLLLGFDNIFIYDNEDQPVYENLIKNEKVKVVHLPGNNYYKAVQYVALEHFINNYINDFTHVAHIDIDEYIVLKKHATINSFIEEYIIDDCAGIGMNWRHFGSNGHKCKNGQKDLFRFTKCEINGNHHIKTIFDVKSYAGWNSPHCIAKQPGKYVKSTNGDIIPENYNENITFDVIQLNHYKSKTLNEFKQIRTRGRADLLVQPEEDVVDSFNKYNINEIEDYTAAVFYSQNITNFVKYYNNEILEGYILPQQKTDLINLFVNLFENKKVNILEIGFNSGHSSDFFLKNFDCFVVSFDLNEHSYVKYAKIYIDTVYPNRHTLITGDSTKTIPQFHHSKFDIIFIDGGHDYLTAKRDLENCKRLAGPETIVIMDDTMTDNNKLANWNIGPNKAWNEAKGSLVKDFSSVDYEHGRGMSWGKYLFTN
jgi:predicted O-methyltransferase YrrM